MCGDKPLVGVIAISKVNHQRDEIQKMFQDYKTIFAAFEDIDAVFAGDVLTEEKDIVDTAIKMEQEGADTILFIVGTWIYSSHVISAVHSIHIPFILYGLSDRIANGNFGASLQIRYVLQEMGKRFLYVYGAAVSSENIEKIKAYTKAAWTVHAVKNKKIATIGGKCMMMYQTQVNEFSWKDVFGVDFPQYDTVQIFAEMEQISEEEAKAVVDDFAKKFDRIVWEMSDTGERIADDAILSQAKMYLAFKRLKDLYDIEVFANKCMPEMASEIYGYKYAACMATCMLNEDGIMTACEADLPAAVTMLFLHKLTGQKVFFADIVRMGENGKKLMFFNCGTAPVSLADRNKPVELWPTPSCTADEGVALKYMKHGTDLERGACVRFDLKCGEEVTIMRIGGNGDTLRFHVATAVTCEREVDPEEILGQRWPGFGLEFEGDVDEFLQHTVGHHYILVHGNWTREIRYLAEIFGVTCELFNGGQIR